MTVTEMASKLDITEMAVRRHLNALEKDKLVEFSLVRQAMGRPTNLYRLTSKGEELFPNNYQGIVLEFLADLEDVADNQMIEELFNRRKNRLTSRLAERFSGKTFEEKIKELETVQNDNGYMVDVKWQDEETVHFIENNCPISKVADRYPIACTCELELLRELMGNDKVECQASMANGSDRCIYVMKKR